MEKQVKTKDKVSEEVMVNPLRKEKVFVRFVPQENGLAGSNKKHVLYGGLAEGAKIRICVPVLRSTGTYKNVLTDNEKDFLERALGLDPNALSVYKSVNNFWDSYKIELTKEGMHLDLSDPNDYIKWKVLLANPDKIAPSVQERLDKPKMSYRFELVHEREEVDIESLKMDNMMQSYKEFGKIDSDYDTMRVLVELLDSRPYDRKSPIEFFRSRINQLIQKDPRVFLRQIKDPMLRTKVLLRRGTELGKISKRGDYYYWAADGEPLCEGNENPTLSIAAKFLNLPSQQEKKFILEEAIESNRE